MNARGLAQAILLLIAFVAAPVQSAADESNFVAKLDGTWKSDWELTKKHIDDECKLNDEAIVMLQRLMGKMTVRYEGKAVTFTMPEIQFKADGKTRKVDGWTSAQEFRILGQTESQIAILTETFEPNDSITLINFDEANVYWVYVGHSPLSGLHVREYFRRIPPQPAVEKEAEQ